MKATREVIIDDSTLKCGGKKWRRTNGDKEESRKTGVLPKMNAKMRVAKPEKCQKTILYESGKFASCTLICEMQ